MARKRAIKPEIQTEKLIESPEIDDSGLPKKPLFRVDEVAAYFDVARSTVYLWVDHGILTAEKYNGTIRVSRESILHCRLANRLKPLEL